MELRRRELETATPAQLRLERVSRLVARPGYIVALLIFVAAWIVVNLLLLRRGSKPFDPPPFAWLEGFLTFVAMLTATVVLVAQNRQTQLAEQRAHLDLQINLLTEQKVTEADPPAGGIAARPADGARPGRPAGGGAEGANRHRTGRLRVAHAAT